MTIVSAKDKHNKPVPADQQEKDRPELERLHEKALKEEITWSMFGGTITVNGRRYQVL